MQIPNSEYLAQMREALDRVESRQDSTPERMQRYSQMSEELTHISATVNSPDRAIAVTAGAGGGIRSVQLREEAMRMSHTQLGSALTATIQQAAAAAARQQAAIVQEFVGDRMDVVGRVHKTQEQVFGAVAEPEGTEHVNRDVQEPTPPRRPRPATNDEPDDGGFGSVFERGSW